MASGGELKEPGGLYDRNSCHILVAVRCLSDVMSSPSYIIPHSRQTSATVYQHESTNTSEMRKYKCNLDYIIKLKVKHGGVSVTHMIKHIAFRLQCNSDP